jgi:hypothetical protein
VCAGKRGFQRFRTIEIRCDDFVSQLRMIGRIARQRAYLELTARLQRPGSLPVLPETARTKEDSIALDRSVPPRRRDALTYVPLNKRSLARRR